MLVAGAFYKSLAKFISLWVPYANATQGSSTYFFPSSQLFQLDQVFYAGLAYLIIFTAVYILRVRTFSDNTQHVIFRIGNFQFHQLLVREEHQAH